MAAIAHGILLVGLFSTATALPTGVSQQHSAADVPAYFILIFTLFLLLSLLSFKVYFLRNRRHHFTIYKESLYLHKGSISMDSFSQPYPTLSEKTKPGFLIGFLGSPSNEIKHANFAALPNYSHHLSPHKSKSVSSCGHSSRRYADFRSHNQATTQARKSMSSSRSAASYQSKYARESRPQATSIGYDQKTSPLSRNSKVSQSPGEFSSRDFRRSHSGLAFDATLATPPADALTLAQKPPTARSPLELAINLASPLSPLSLFHASMHPVDESSSSLYMTPSVVGSPGFQHDRSFTTTSAFISSPPAAYTPLQYQQVFHQKHHPFVGRQTAETSQPPIVTSPAEMQLSTSDRISAPSLSTTRFMAFQDSFSSSEYEDITRTSPPIPQTPLNFAATTIMNQAWKSKRSSAGLKRNSIAGPSPLRHTISPSESVATVNAYPTEDNSPRSGDDDTALSHNRSDTLEESSERGSLHRFKNGSPNDVLDILRELVDETSTWEDTLFMNESFRLMMEESNVAFSKRSDISTGSIDLDAMISGDTMMTSSTMVQLKMADSSGDDRIVARSSSNSLGGNLLGSVIGVAR